MERYDLVGARRASEEGRLLEWLVALLQREPGANRALAAILKGQRPHLEGPVRLPLDGLVQGAGPGGGFKWRADPVEWEASVAAILRLAPEALPPMIIRETAGARHLSDGNHRLDAWRRRGETHGWAVVAHDRDPRFAGWWGPFLPDETPTIGTVDSAEEFLPPAEAEGTVLAATLNGRVVAAVRLVPEFGGRTLRTMRVAPELRGLRLGARLLRELQPLMDGHVTHCLAYPRLARFYGEVGFRPVGEASLPEGLHARWAAMQDELGCVALRREA